jgi:release factor glutamine methyltransferase
VKVPSNKISDIRRYYTAKLAAVSNQQEAKYAVDSVLARFTEIPRMQLALHGDERVGESLLLKIHFAVKELLRNRPLQYVLGETECLGRRFRVDERVLIPRPETEELLTEIIADVKNSIPASALDIGTGSACIAINLAKAFQGKVYAMDISQDALKLAAQNARLHKVDIDFIEGDILDKSSWAGLPVELDLIVSNPPYVRMREKQQMQANVLDFEPEVALFVSDDDPLIFYRHISAFAAGHLAPEGLLWLEINEFLAEETKSLLEKEFSEVELFKDYKGAWRFVRAQSVK